VSLVWYEFQSLPVKYSIIDLNPEPISSERTNNSVVFMFSTGHATSPSNFQLIVDALADYAKQTGIDLSISPLAERLELSNSPQAILELLQARENDFIEYRHRNQKLINCIRPAVEVLHAFSGALGEVAGSVSNTCCRVNLQ
jgi:hypothetical protein